MSLTPTQAERLARIAAQDRHPDPQWHRRADGAWVSAIIGEDHAFLSLMGRPGVAAAERVVFSLEDEGTPGAIAALMESWGVPPGKPQE